MLPVISSHRIAPVQEQVEEDLSYLIIVCIMKERGKGFTLQQNAGEHNLE